MTNKTLFISGAVALAVMVTCAGRHAAGLFTLRAADAQSAAATVPAQASGGPASQGGSAGDLPPLPGAPANPPDASSGALPAPASPSAVLPADTPLPTPTLIYTGTESTERPTKPVVNSRYAVLMDVQSGKLLWYRNPDVRRSIASTTKIMTAILLIERGKPGAIVTAPPGLDKLPEDSLHLKPGETIPLHDLLYAMLLRSANDSAVAGADYLSGSVPAFAVEMNKKAQEIGVKNTNFVTPNGLYDPNHYSTAADLALIARYAVLNVPEFNQIVKTQTYKLTRSIDKSDVWVKNTSCKFLREFPGADGIKTGFIHQAGHCFVGSATRHNWRLIAVALNSNKCREDVESLLNFGFNDFQRVLTMHQGDAAGTIIVPTATLPVSVSAAADVSTAVQRWKPLPQFSYRVVPLATPPTAPIYVGEKVGTIEVIARGGVQATCDAIADAAVAARPVLDPAVVVHGGGFVFGLLRFIGAILLIMLGGRLYARTVAKGSGRGRDRVAPDLRGIH